MSKPGKKTVDAQRRYDREQLFAPTEALELVRSMATRNFDESVEAAFRLGVDPRKADQMIRGTVSLPNGTGKSARVAVFAQGDAAREAQEAGADFVGSDDLIAQIEGGMLDFDVAIATPDLMGQVGKLGRTLGPRGLMPNPKTGTVTNDVGKTVGEFKAGKVEYRTDRYGNVHVPIGKASFDTAGAGRELPRGARRAAPGQAGIGQGPLPAQRHHQLHHGPRGEGRPRLHAPRRAGDHGFVVACSTSTTISSATDLRSLRGNGHQLLRATGSRRPPDEALSY